MSKIVTISVSGEPAPKGSMKAFVMRSKDGKYQARITNDNKRTKSWQDDVTRAIRGTMMATGLEMIDDAVKVTALFFLRKPKSAKRSHPSAKPDLDKLQRVIGDALEGTLITNDSRITKWDVAKIYSDNPGCQITVEPVGEK